MFSGLFDHLRTPDFTKFLMDFFGSNRRPLSLGGTVKSSPDRCVTRSLINKPAFICPKYELSVRERLRNLESED